MIQINVTDRFQDVLNNNTISVIKTNPISTAGTVRYVGSDFIVEKVVKKVEPHWSGKKIVTLQVTYKHKNEVKIESQKIQVEQVNNYQVLKKQQRRKKDGK